MKRSQLITTAITATLLTSASVIGVAAHNSAPTPVKPRVTTSSDSNDGSDNTLPVYTTTMEPTTPPETEQTPVPTDPTPVTSDPAPAPTPTAALQATVTQQAAATAAALHMASVSDFSAIQWGCISRGLNDSSPFDSLATVLTPTSNADGTTTYRYFDNLGTCRLLSRTV